MASASDQPSPQTQTYSVILFYKYAPLSDDETKMSILRDALEELCSKLNLTGRILLGMSTDAEGINGTLAGRKEDVVACTLALLRETAGIANGTMIFCLPGSQGACRTGWEGILKAQLDARHKPCNFAELIPRFLEQ